jgi:hypothetical protein
VSNGRFTRVAVLVALLTALVASGIVLTATMDMAGRPFNPSDQVITSVFVADAVLVAVLAVGIFIRRARLEVGAGLAWTVGVVSALASLIPWFLVARGFGDLGSAFYTALKVPRGMLQFWDLSLVLQSIDCARQGFDVYQEGNGCLEDPSIYAPGMGWLRVIPAAVLSNEVVGVWGVVLIAVMSLALLWLARRSAGIGQIVLLIAAVGGPWLLLLERGNIDAAVFLTAVVVAIMAGRRDSLAMWAIAAALIWVMGTWKYYPFVLGLMLLPVLRLRRGWVVIAGFAAAAVAFVVATLPNLRASSEANSDMAVYIDFVILGRTPLAARMEPLEAGLGSPLWTHAVVWLLGLLAIAWGLMLSKQMKRPSMTGAMLSSAGGALFLVAILYAGFGWGYKATFLLLLVPLFSAAAGSSRRFVASTSLVVVVLIGICSVVVWNTLIATTCGIVAAGVGLGAGFGVMLREIRGDRGADAPASTVAAGAE